MSPPSSLCRRPSTSNPTHLAQLATLAAITGPQAPVETMRKAFDERRIAMVELLRAIPGASCREPKGAVYAFADLSAVVGRATEAIASRTRASRASSFFKRPRHRCVYADHTRFCPVGVGPTSPFAVGELRMRR